MPGSSTTPGRLDARVHAPIRVAFRIRNGVGTRDKNLCEAQWLACVLLYRRFAAALTGGCARLEADVVSYSFIVSDLHRLLVAGLPAHCERFWTLPVRVVLPLLLLLKRAVVFDVKEKSRHSTALAVFEHVSCPSCQPSPALRLANCESDIAISASQAIEGTVITAAAAPGWISWANLGSGTHAARALSASITRAGIW
jgi:hypothetical protein